MVCTALLAVPLGITAALYLEEFADTETLVQPADRGQPAEPRGGAVDRLRPAGGRRDGRASASTTRHRPRRRHRAGAADPAGHHHHHPRGGPGRAQEIRQGSLALGATVVADHVAPDAAVGGARASRPARSSASPGRSARPHRCIMVGFGVSVRFDPERAGGLSSVDTSLPIQIYTLTSQSQEEFQARRLGRHHRAAGHDPRHERPRHLHPQQVPDDPGRSTPMPTQPATTTTREPRETSPSTRSALSPTCTAEAERAPARTSRPTR